eukprot:s254_g30.t2
MPDDSVSEISEWSRKRPAEWWPEDEGYRGWCSVCISRLHRYRRSREYREYREYREHRVRVVVKDASEGEAQEAMVKKARWHGHFVESSDTRAGFELLMVFS